MLTDRVQELERSGDVEEMWILYAYYNLEETHSLVQFQPIENESLEQYVGELE